MEWSPPSTNFEFGKDVYSTSRADINCCGRRGLVEGWKRQLGRGNIPFMRFLLILAVAKPISSVLCREGLGMPVLS